MIQLLASKYRKRIAYLLLILFDCSFTFSAKASVGTSAERLGMSFKTGRGYDNRGDMEARSLERKLIDPVVVPADLGEVRLAGLADRKSPVPGTAMKQLAAGLAGAVAKPAIGGPTQPEMTSFKTVDDKNLVDLFTGDFHYNIPLLDVGGYPVNIFYSGEVGMEQEASWVGLGWNINPGTISRNMRGVPDDFDGTDTLVQIQNMKPNKTWGVSAGADFEGVGWKFLNLGGNLGVSFNNYLGMSLDLGVKGGVAFKVAGKAAAEHNGSLDTADLKLGASLGLDINSREGMTFSPGVSLTAFQFFQGLAATAGVGLSTSYNSRTGIKGLQLYEQQSLSKGDKKEKNAMAHFSNSLYSTSISFARPSYIPEIRMPMSNTSSSYHVQVGAANWGAFASAEGEYYQQISRVNPKKIVQYKPMVGYLYSERAMKNADAVMDFSRLNDREVTPHTPVISAPQYSYDVFSIQGEGTGGSVRAYRSDLGYARDNYTGSSDDNITAGADAGLFGHYGANINVINTPTSIGEWGSGNKIKTATAFQPALSNSAWEKVYFRNPGETTVLSDNQFSKVGGTSLVRFQLSGSKYNPAIEPRLAIFSNEGAATGQTITLSKDASSRTKRKQVVSFLTADEASVVGLDKSIKSYGVGILNFSAIKSGVETDSLYYDTISRVGGYRKGHHISEIDVTEPNGKRYVYGIPVYNVSQKDMTFTVDSSTLSTPDQSDKIVYGVNEACAILNDSCTATNSNLGDGTGGRNGYVQTTETPAYAHSFLLSGLLSPDYVDLTGDGISDDDLGNAVKFNYQRVKNYAGWYDHKWRTPVDRNKANFNAGNRSDVKDDKGLVSYGVRESWYLHSIESKTMIAVFVVGNRQDGRNVISDYGGVVPKDSSLKCLTEINLYSKADLRHGLTNAKPIKTVHFEYDSSLCIGTPDNPGGGKLTLKRIYFTYNGQSRLNKEQYVFSYTNKDGSGNPTYEFNAADRWGSYKPGSMNPGGLRNSEYPYTIQNTSAASVKTTLDANAGAWALKKILLPSGGQIEVQYESDDYAYVQNLRATQMMSVAGFGITSTSMSNRLYGVDTSLRGGEGNYMFVKVPRAVYSKNDVYQKYLQGIDQIAVKLAVNMPSGKEFVTAYTTFDDYGYYDSLTVWVHMVTISGYSPLTLTALEYLRERLPKDAFPGYDISESAGLAAVGKALSGMWAGIKSAFSDVIGNLHSSGKAETVVLSQTFARLDNPDGCKYGGGQRVKSITLKDNWNAMKGAATSSYTQNYDYTTTETFNGSVRTISSGVASYEPALGGDENPFQTIIRVKDKLPAGPASYGAIENPVLDGLFQAPVVGYSQVTVRSLSSIPIPAGQKSRSAIGRQVTQFYTAKDYPVSYYYTPLTSDCDLEAHENSSLAFLYKYAFDSRALSQGFLLNLNDMHGKLLSQSSYAANDSTLLVNYTQNYYRNTGANGLGENFNFVHANHGDTIESGNMGIDVELMTDTREFSVKSSSVEVQANADVFGLVVIPTAWPVVGSSENTYRAVTTTKVVNYHAVLDSVVVIDKGSQVSTKNLLYDGETGDVLVTRTNNEFNQPIYSTTYPAWWAYSGMGPACENIGREFSGLNIYEGKIMNVGFDQSVFESGDEFYVTSATVGGGCYGTYASTGVNHIWALDLNKNNSSLAGTSHDFMFIDETGTPYTDTLVSLKVIRSGKRNLLDEQVAAVASMASPIMTSGSVSILNVDSSTQVVNASAINYREKWQADRDVIQTYATVFNSATCTYAEQLYCSGYLEKQINPYRRGLLGNFQNEKSLVSYGSRSASSSNGLISNGFINGFSPYWKFNQYNNLIPDTANANWLWKDKVTRVNARGMQLETQDALGIYTSALYGYNKNLPTAICNNAAYFETEFEGFEDSSYNNFLNGDSVFYCSNEQHLDLSSMTNSQVLKTDALSFGAHTGKYVLGVNAKSSATQTFSVASTASNYDFGMRYTYDTVRSIYQTGRNITSEGCIPNYHGATSTGDQSYLEDNILVPTGGAGYRVLLDVDPKENGSAKTHSFQFNVYYYSVITQPADYTFKVGQSVRFGDGSGSNDDFVISFSIVDIKGNVFANKVWNQRSVTENDVTVHLCPGIYKIYEDVSDTFSASITSYNTSDPIEYQFYIMCQSLSVGDAYKSLTTQNGCIQTVPIAATDSMLQPVFHMSAGKRMLVSAWVHEDSCGVASSPGSVCNQTAFSNSKITVNAGGSDSTLLPVGPIIDGWQRFEGYVTAPATGTSGRITFTNTSSNMIYFDDIRIHPFNADMKTYVYDPVNLRLVAESDANNYATFYEYDAEGTLVRTKAETREGVKTIKETRSAKQRSITDVQ